MIVRTAQPEHFRYLTEATGYRLGGDACAIEAVDEGGRIRGMVLFDLWTPASAHMHVRLDTAIATRSLLRPAFEFIFGQAARDIAIAVIPSFATRCLRFARKLGFSETHRTIGGWSKESDLVQLELRRRDCRWFSTEKVNA